MVEFESIPDGLRSTEQWICWGQRDRDGTATKVPLDPKTMAPASVTDSHVWTGLGSAVSSMERTSAASGVGFVFTKGDSFVGIDLDHCRDPDTGQPTRWAKEIIQQLDSFTEVSPSGTGYHVYVRGSLPAGGNRSGDVELYETARFFTVTGNHVSGTPKTVQERQAALEDVHAEHIASDENVVQPTGDGAASSVPGLDDETLLTKAQNAKNGEKFSHLWRGHTGGYDSHSEADMALCFLLAFWSGGDAVQMDRLFRQSGLYREKWDESHYADGSTYGEQTIQRAITRTSDFYEPSPEDGADGSVDRPVETAQSTPTASDSATESPVEPSAFEALVADVEALQQRTEKIETLDSRLTALQSQNEYLHEQLLHEQNRQERLVDRLVDIEDTLERHRNSVLGRLYARFA